MQGGAQASRRPARVHGVKHDAGRRDDISWMSLIRTARVPFAFQALVAAGLLLPPQMRDMLAALAETHAWRPWAAFPASMAVFGFLSWYWARATLSARLTCPIRGMRGMRQWHWGGRASGRSCARRRCTSYRRRRYRWPA